MTEFQNQSTGKSLPLDLEKWREVISDWESSKESQKQYRNVSADLRQNFG